MSAKTADMWKRLFGLFASIMELVVADRRYAVEVADVLQVIKDKKDFAIRLGIIEVSILRLQVDYDMSVEKAIRVGKYDWEDKDINDKNFSSQRSGPAQIDIHLVHFKKDMSPEYVLAGLDKMGLRPAELSELLALGAEYPDEQRKYPIVALGSVWPGCDGDRHIPYLYWGRSGRGLYLDCSGLNWRACSWFAAVQK